MLSLVLLLAFGTVARGDPNVLSDIECVVRMEAVHECKSDAWEHFWEVYYDNDGRPDYEERKFCNLMTSITDNCTQSIVGSCFQDEEVNFWIDNDLSNYLDGLEELYTNWDTQKCPPFRKMLERKALKEKEMQSGTSQCQVKMKEFHKCRQTALLEKEASDYNNDGRKDFSERKQCNFETAWLTCPKKLLGVCKTQAEIERVQYWQLINDDFEFENWEADKCPAVKEVATRWNALKEKLRMSTETVDKSNTVEVVKTASEMDLSDECATATSCRECEQKPGCGWCSSPERDLATRCNTKEQNEEICPLEGREKKHDEDPVILKQHVDLKWYMSPQFIQLRPKHVEMGLNVGEIKTLPFTYMFMLNGNTFTHNLPDHIELKIFSNCGSGGEVEVKECRGIRNGRTVKFKAQFRLKYCPKDASLWTGSYQIHNSQGDYGDDEDLHVDFKLFCTCSCDKYGTEKVCRNDKKSYLDVNPCAAKDSCNECLQNVSCNWCAGSKYSHQDGSPLPRCNGDDFFASTLCPSDTRVDPPRALTASEDCSTCNHTCSGGLCTEDKKDIIESNVCVSQLSCGDCTKLPGCAWCSDEGIDHCNLISYFNGKDSCNQELYSNQTSCACEDKCHPSYEKYSPSCNGGDKVCGACQNCPKESKGWTCECSTDISNKEKLTELPSVSIGKKDDLLINSGEMKGNEFGFHHIIPPMETNPGALRCNSTYCMNANSKQCYKSNWRRKDYDHGRFANLFAIYGDHRLLPGSELVFKIAHCPLKEGDWDRHETWFGFGSPVSKDQEYTLPRKYNSDIIPFYTDNAYVWKDQGPKFGDHSGKTTQFGLQHCSTERNWFYETREVYNWGCRFANVTGVDEYLGNTDMEYGTEIKLVVTETEAVWSWEGFHDEKSPTLTEARLPINIQEHHFYPFFILPGCNEEGQFSAIELVSSKVKN